MGLDINAARFLLGEMQRGVDFSHTLTLGHQEVYIPASQYARLFENPEQNNSTDNYSDAFFRRLGCKDLEFMDASDYEGATVIHDLNNPIPEQLACSYGCVIDGGTLEHIFNLPVALKNCMEMVNVGGHLILMTPWHNWAGHGFYEFSPELFYTCLSPENGFVVERMLIADKHGWYSVANPAEIGGRVEIKSMEVVTLFISAKRTARCPIFAKWPQQSDYSTAWSAGVYGGPTVAEQHGLVNRLVKCFPWALKPVRELWRKIKPFRHLMAPLSNTRFFRSLASVDGIPQAERQNQTDHV